MSPSVQLLMMDAESRLLGALAEEYASCAADAAGVVIRWSAGAHRLTGRAAGEVIGQPLAALFAHDDRAVDWPRRLLELLQRSGQADGDAALAELDGRPHPVRFAAASVCQADGALIGYAFAFRSQRGAAAQADDHSLRLLIDSVVDYAIYMIDLDGQIVTWNPGAVRVKGYSAAEIVGRNFSRFFTEEDQRAGRPAHILRVALQAGRYTEEGWRVRRDGSQFWAHVVLDAVRNEQGVVIGFAKVTRDVTQRQALEVAREQLYQAQKMDAVGQLTGGVAHDFNNLLAVISGSLELIGANPHDEVGSRRMIATALHAAERGAKLTSQLLAFSRKQPLRPQACNPGQLVRDVETLLRRAVGDAVLLDLQLATEAWDADIDPAQFQSALLNLAINARDAMPGGGTLAISTENVMLGPSEAAALTEISDGPYIVVTVRDNGSGMTPDVKARAVEPFYTTKDADKGSGLGLSQVYGFVRQSGGQIRITSQVGRGTSVAVYLPRLAVAGVAVATATAAESLGTVLVVDDDVDVLDIATVAVRSFGYQVHFATDAYEALTMLHRNPEIGILFTDVVLPKGMSGVELAREALVARPDLHVLLSSGYPREALHGSEDLLGDIDFLAKPYALDTLRARLAAFRDPPVAILQQA